MITLDLNSIHHGFRVVGEGEVYRLSAHYKKLRHEATGATLYYTDRDDGQKVFAVGFRTLPDDDTGVFHILEHSCLDGSEKYPLKEPFVDLIKTSMAVDLNAMTYEDKTVYYFISTNERDYMNLMAVYLDAVFFPLLLTDRRIFEKEAWHFEPNGEGGVSISGVVFNEMQGTKNRPLVVLWEQNRKQLFPDLPHCTVSSGGDPLAIPDLTYEQFTETYRRFYTAENAVFYLSGDMGIEEQLAYIDGILRKKGTSPYEKPAPAPLQAPVVSHGETVYYQLPGTEEEAGNTHLLLSYVTAPDRPEEILALSLLSRYLAETTESPLERVVLASGVGQDFTMIMEEDRQPTICFMMGKSDPEHAEPFRRVILETLGDLVRRGFDHDCLSALVSAHETDCRRASLSVDSGFRIMESFLRQHIRSDDVQMVDGLEALRAAMSADERYFEHLIERYVLQSDHWALTACVPSRTVAAERQAEMAMRCEREAARLQSTPNGWEDLAAHMEAFGAYLTAPDDPTAAASVPHLSSSEITTEDKHRDLVMDTTPVGGVSATSFCFEAETDGMVEAGILLELTSVPEEDLFYVACLQDALLSLPTEEHTPPALSDAWVRLHTIPHGFVRLEMTSHAYFTLVLDTPEERLPDAVALLDEYIRTVKFDRATLRQLFANASHMRDHLITAGNRTALWLATRTMTVSGMYNDHLHGLTAYRRYAALADRFEEHADALAAGMQRVWEHLTTSVKPYLYLIGSKHAYGTWCHAVKSLSLAAAVPEEMPDLRPRPLPRRNSALVVPREVNCCAEVFDLTEGDIPYDSPRRQVIDHYLFSRYFWDEIRAKGGAYGAGAVAFRQGVQAYTSYRDPRLGETFAAFDHLPDWMDSHIPTKEEVDALIVSIMGSAYCAPASPLDLGRAALGRWLNAMTVADRRAEIKTILTTTPADFAEYAEGIRRLIQDGRQVRTVVGNDQLIRRSGLFSEDEIIEL